MGISSPHINAQPGDFAKTVLMPGDPKRAEFIASHYFENPVLVNDVRGVQGYTGMYKGRRVSVMASGMGMPSISIYAYELYKFFDVENIIRVGTAGSYDPALHLGDLILAQGACTNSKIVDASYNLPGTFCPIADFDLLRMASLECDAKNYRYKVGNIFSTDTYYSDTPETDWFRMGVLGVDMESAALYAVAARTGKHALTICTVSNSFVYPEEDATAEERQTKFTNMMEVALDTAHVFSAEDVKVGNRNLKFKLDGVF